MSTRPQLKLDRRAIGRFLKQDAQLRAALLARARRVAGQVPGATSAIDETDRAVARVIFTEPDALIDEANTGARLRALDSEAGT